MTFKHEKFDDSAVMRSLEKVAREKGWVESKPITKSASNKLNVSPSSNLVDNVMRLCAGLRQSGLEKYALDIENKFIAFKQAATLYDAHGEKGEDLIDAAHSEGSHKMEGLDNAVFKTILDKHLDFVNVVNKKPTGKLANNKDILKAVKIVLAEEAVSKEVLEKEINTNLAEGLRRWNAIDNIIDKEGGLVGFTIGRGTQYNIHSSYIKDLFVERPATLDNLKSLKNRINSALATIKPGVSLSGGSFNPWGGVSQDVYERVTPVINTLNDFVNKAYNARVKVNEINAKEIIGGGEQTTTPTASTSKIDPVADKIAAVRRELNGIVGLVDADTDANQVDKNAMKAWLSKRDVALKSIESSYKERTPEAVYAALNKITKGFDVAKQRWS